MLVHAPSIASQLAIVDRGRVVAAGTPDALKRELRGDAIHVELDAENGHGEPQAALDRLETVRDVVVQGGSLHARADDGARTMPAVLQALEAHGVGVASVTSRGRRSTTSTCSTRGGRSTRPRPRPRR
jgi:ABC-2 type transport system ATP-binding protein